MTLKPWIIEQRVEFLAPDDIDPQVLERSVAILMDGVMILSEQVKLSAAEIALVPATNGHEPVDVMNPKRVIKTKKPKAAKKAAGGGRH